MNVIKKTEKRTPTQRKNKQTPSKTNKKQKQKTQQKTKTKNKQKKKRKNNKKTCDNKHKGNIKRPKQQKRTAAAKHIKNSSVSYENVIWLDGNERDQLGRRINK